MSKKEIAPSILVRDLPSDSDIYRRSSSDLVPTTFWDSVKLYLYNPRKKTCCHRTSSQWITMLLYYIGYTVFIIALFLGFLLVTLTVIKSLYPDNSIIDRDSLLDSAAPGLGFVPNIVVTKYPIIWYSSDPSEGKTKDEYVKSIDKFFKKYKDAKKEDYVNCPSDKKENKLCYFDIAELKECSGDGYFFTNNSLCFFLKLNRRRQWKPSFFKTEKDLPDEMSSSMTEHILQSSGKEIIHVECLGKNLWDNEHMGEMQYLPKQGFDGYYFPYEGESKFLPPIVAVKMSGVTTGVMIHIQCTVWVKNIEPRLNHLHVKIFIDNRISG